MILNVSGRCDIVAFYTPWFINRYNAGFVDVRNPFNPKLVSRINFEDVDLIMFCTKNPKPILGFLDKIDKPILFHVTLTPYKDDIEPGVKDKKDIVESIKKLSQMVGIDNLYIRYDPVFLSDKYDLHYHKKAFDKMCTLLDGYVKHIIISFMDEYKNVKKNRNILKYRSFTENDYKEIGLAFSNSAKCHGISVQTCFEERNLVEYGFINGDCISKELAYRMTGKSYKKWKARAGNKCNCVEMVDIGVYNSCKHFCKYCYANYDEDKVLDNYNNHDPNISLLVGHLENDDVIKERK